jgi:cytochrome c-type biogenesis protein CcmH/NrfG
VLLAAFTVADGVSIATALLLAVGAIFAWRTYKLSAQEHEEGREEARRAPYRQRLDDIYRELKYLVAATQKRDVAREHQLRSGGRPTEAARTRSRLRGGPAAKDT